jgi:fatty-acyl-CoA synthase
MKTIVEVLSGHPTPLTVHDAAGSTRTLTWAEVHDRAGRLAAALRQRGVGPGRRVALLADTSVEVVVAVRAVWLAGAAVTMLPLPTRPGDGTYRVQLHRVVADAGPHLVITDGPVGLLPAPVADLNGLLAASRELDPAPPVAPAPTDLAILQYTCGGTGYARGVPVTHGHLAANLAALRADHDRVHGCLLSWLPLHHDMGMVGFLALPMACGCPLVLQSPYLFARRPGSWLELITSHQATASGAPTSAFALLNRLLGPDAGYRLGSLRSLVCAGEPVDATVMSRFAALVRPYGLDSAALVAAYGRAESTFAVTAGSGVRLDRIDPYVLAALGRAIPTAGRRRRDLVRLGPAVEGTEIRVVDRRTGQPAAERRVGHVEIRGASVVGHYWPDPPPPAGGWFRTTDLGYLADGDLVVCGSLVDRDHPWYVEVAGVGRAPGAAFGVPGRPSRTRRRYSLGELVGTT